jgi:hypothetical protein
MLHLDGAGGGTAGGGTCTCVYTWLFIDLRAPIPHEQESQKLGHVVRRAFAYEKSLSVEILNVCLIVRFA